ncbi:Uncharacterised protein [Mycobacterium tuberculosis]|nr:Uncharacterised protein [Mycobacterium tuberculosis]
MTAAPTGVTLVPVTASVLVTSLITPSDTFLLPERATDEFDTAPGAYSSSAEPADTAAALLCCDARAVVACTLLPLSATLLAAVLATALPRWLLFDTLRVEPEMAASAVVSMA